MLSVGVDATRFIGDPPTSRILDETFRVMATRPVNAAPRAATCVLRSANDDDDTSRVVIEVNCGGVAGATVVWFTGAVANGDDPLRRFAWKVPSMAEPASAWFRETRGSDCDSVGRAAERS